MSETRIYELLKAWGTSAHVEAPLGGGYRNRLWAVRVAGGRYAARLSPRPTAALDWEIRLLRYLREAEVVVPEVLPARDGRMQVDGLILFGWLEGQQPSTDRDWRSVAGELSRIHALARDWPQRPAFHSSLDLLEESQGGDVRLDRMPTEVVERVRSAWRALEGEPLSVVHGDPGAGNIRIVDGRAGFIDWDESRVDVSLLDLAALPVHLAQPEPERLATARRAAIAWEIANGWLAEPEYAQRLLAEFDRA